MANVDRLSILITGFILLLVGVVFIQVVADRVYTTRNTEIVRNDTFTPSNNTCVEVATGCITSINSLTNATQDVVTSSFYEICRYGGGTNEPNGIEFSATTDPSARWVNDSLNASYQHSPDCTYVQDSASRTLLDLLTIFFAITLVLIGVAIFMKIKEDYF